MGLKDLFGGGNQPLQAAADQVSPGTLERPRALHGDKRTSGFGQYAACRPDGIPGIQVRHAASNEYHHRESYGHRHSHHPSPLAHVNEYRQQDDPRFRDAPRVSRHTSRTSGREYGPPEGLRPLTTNDDNDDPPLFPDSNDQDESWNLTEFSTAAPPSHTPMPPRTAPREAPPRASYRPGAPLGMTRQIGPRPVRDAPARSGSRHGLLRMDAGTALQFFGNIVRDFIQAPPIPSPTTNPRIESLPPPPGGAQRARRHSSFDLRLLPEPSPRDYERVTVRIEMLEDQEELYNVMQDEARRYIQEAGAGASNVHKILMNLRLACNSIDLLPPALRRHLEQRIDGGRLGHGLLHLLQDTSRENPDDSVCPVCLDGLPEVRTACGHVFHKECLDDWLSQRATTCPMCRIPIDIRGVQVCDHLHHAVLQAEELSKSTMIHLEAGAISHVSSNKLTKVSECICVEIQNYRDLNDPNEEPPKFILVSSFRPMLMDMSRILQSFGIRYHWCFPSMAKSVIRDELTHFSRTDQPVVLLLHARAVSTKMDFSAATFMYFMDPWKEGKLNKIAEGCLCRNRRGRKCLIANFISMGSIEEELTLESEHCMPADPIQLASRIINPLA